MAEHGVILARKMQSQNVDALNRNAIATVDVDNGTAVVLGDISTDADKSQVFTATLPADATALGVWIADEPTLGVAEDALGGQYSVGIKDPRKFYNPTGRVFAVRKAMTGDIFTISADMVTGTISAGSFINVDPSGKFKAATTEGTGFAAKIIENDFISIGMQTATLTQRLDAYKFEVVQN